MQSHISSERVISQFFFCDRHILEHDNWELHAAGIKHMTSASLY